IRDGHVTGVQTCALPILHKLAIRAERSQLGLEKRNVLALVARRAVGSEERDLLAGGHAAADAAAAVACHRAEAQQEKRGRELVRLHSTTSIAVTLAATLLRPEGYPLGALASKPRGGQMRVTLPEALPRRETASMMIAASSTRPVTMYCHSNCSPSRYMPL